MDNGISQIQLGLIRIVRELIILITEKVKKHLVIMEETGISVRNIRYFGSQSWPFPSQLMLGFTAEYESGEIHVQESELQRAAWFPRNNCPATPPKGSIAYRLIHQE